MQLNTQAQLRKREALELELALLADAQIEVEASSTVSDRVAKIVERLVENRKKEIERELIYLPE